MRINRSFLGAASVLAVLAAAPPVGAQEDDDFESVQDTEVTDTIIVTVERREQSLQDLGGTAAAVQGETLKALNIVSLEDLDGSVPGLQVANTQGNVEVYIRGIGSSNNTELGDPAAATHLNGVYIPRPAGLGAAFFDVERVEVNVGPQGTLRGRNATAGSVNIIPFAPGLGVTDFMLEAGYGNYDETRFEGMANVALGERAAIRLSGYALNHDSYYENVTLPSNVLGVPNPTSEREGVGVAEAADDLGVRLGLRVEPTDAITLTLTADYLEQKGTGYTGTNYANPLSNGIAPDEIDNPREVYGRGFTPEEDTEHYGFVADASWDLGPVTLNYIGSYRDLVYDYEFVTPAAPQYDGFYDLVDIESTFDNFSRVRFITDSESTVHELRLSRDDPDGLTFTAGAFYFEEDQRTFLGTTGDRNPFFSGVEFNQTTATESYSFFGDATYALTDDLRITGGVRYTNDEKERFGVNARYQFIVGGAGFSCCFGVGQGTEGFEFAGLDRTILNPDTDGDGNLTDDEILAFYFDGVAQFGERDGFDDIFANGIIPGDAPVEARPFCDAFAFRGPCPVADGQEPFFDDALAGRISFAVLGGNAIALQNGRLDNDFVDWRARVEYDASDDNLLYALVATGAKSGGFNDNIPGTEGLGTFNPARSAPAAFDADTLAPTYDPERVTLFEVGSKNEFGLGEVSAVLNASAFYYDYADLQLTTLTSTAQVLEFEGIPVDEVPEGLGGNVVAFTFNAANAEIYGAQFEGSLRFPDDLKLSSTVLFLETEIVDSVEIQDARFQADVAPEEAVNRSIEGNDLPRTPNVQINASLSKAWRTSSGQFDAVASVGYRSSAFQTIFNGVDYVNPDEPRLRLDDKVDGYVLVDVGAGYSFGFDEKLRLEAYVNNLFDEQQEQAIIITQFDNTRFFNRPRTFGVRARTRF